ncbi:MAG: hypothetical protein ACK5BV_01075 [Bacteroidota bacterium]
MSKIKGPVRNLTALDKEIYRLQLEAIKTEGKLGDNLKYVKHHFPEMVLGSITQRFASRSLWASVFDLMLQNDNLRSKMGKGAEWLATKSADWIKRKFGG